MRLHLRNAEWAKVIWKYLNNYVLKMEAKAN
jgi:hypothetical protein